MSAVRTETIRTVVIKGYGRHRQATKACEAWVLKQGGEWWSKKGYLAPRPQAYDIWRARDAKMYRRALPIFKKVLP